MGNNKLAYQLIFNNLGVYFYLLVEKIAKGIRVMLKG